MKYRDVHLSNAPCTLGFDIEFALLNTKGNPVSAIPYVMGTKDNPKFCDGGNMQRDNIAFEVAIDYADNVPEVIRNIQVCLSDSILEIPKGYRLACIPSAIFADRELKHAEAQEFRCDPDYDAKTGKVTEFTDIVDPNLRSFGLHVHTGRVNTLDPRTHVLASDLTLGLFSTLKDNSPDALTRRKLYGKPSSYRVKEYGVEYRTLSNYFCKSPRLIRIVAALNRAALILGTHYKRNMYTSIDFQEVSDVIMAGDEVRAAELFFKHVFDHCDFELQSTIIDELEHDNYRTFEKEWMLDYTRQYATTHQALREDYYPKPDIQREAL